MKPSAHMFPRDLEAFGERECFATAFSIPVGSPEGSSVPLFEVNAVLDEIAKQAVRLGVPYGLKDALVLAVANSVET